MTERSRGSIDPHANPETWAPRLQRALDDQQERYEQLRDLSVRQGELIRSMDTDGLLRILARRQVLVDQINEANQEIEPFRKEWDRLVEGLPDQHRDRLRRRIESLEEVVNEIVRRDEEDKTLLENQRTRVASEMETVNRSRSAMNAYQRTAQTEGPRYQDRQG